MPSAQEKDSCGAQTFDKPGVWREWEREGMEKIHSMVKNENLGLESWLSG